MTDHLILIVGAVVIALGLIGLWRGLTSKTHDVRGGDERSTGTAWHQDGGGGD
ncbi:hypothetical protein [Sphingomonas lenta]|uniref:hypothetical protein n=1 Tax=Sphingomonas lenta TaxID=1141887 RepID=UPI00159602CB|nr:hypothetical protein [Sphingomonas lenta]